MKIRTIFLALVAVALLAGCASVDENGQRAVTRPNMQFSRSTVYSYSSKLMPQIQAGLAVSGGELASTCTLCR